MVPTGAAPRGFCKATVSAWRASLEVRGLGSSSIIIRMSAIRKLAAEAADNGLIAPELAAGIARVKSAKSVGIRTGNWLSVRQTQNLLNAPDITTLRGLRDRAILAVLLGCGLRRSEVAALTFIHIQQRKGRWCIVDLLGKHGRIRTMPMPAWVKRLLTPKEAAEFLGLQVDTIYKKSRLRELPSVKVGRALRFDVVALNRYVEQHTIKNLE